MTVVDTWQVRLPTTLIWLVNRKPDGQLPANLNPTIDTTPKIVSLTPSSGAVGDLITVAGRNFRDIQGSSTVEFNGTPATPARWSADSIDVAVPVGTATGNVVVTVKIVVSDGVAVNSVQSNDVNLTVN